MREEEVKTPTKTGEPKIGIKQVEGIIVGRDKAVVPPEEVEKLAALGCKDREIAEWFQINEDTLRYNFKPFLVKGRCQLKQSLRRAMLNAAINNANVVMMIFLAKNFLDMSDNGTTSSEEPLPWIEREQDEETIGEQDENTKSIQ